MKLELLVIADQNAAVNAFPGLVAALSQHHLSGFEIALLEFHHLHSVRSDAF